jgi:hypothetical protein
MNPEQIHELLDHDPFEAFVIKLTNGDIHVVQSPHAVAVMGTRLFLAMPDDRWVFIPLTQITSIESLQVA